MESRGQVGLGPAPTRIWKRSLLFRRGRTLAGPPKGLCHSGAHPHPPRIRSAPSPKGEGCRAGRGPAPTTNNGADAFFLQGPVPDWPAGGASPSPTGFKENFRVWVGEALGPPAVNGPGTVCLANPGAEMEPQNLEFLLTQAPVGRREFRPAAQILRAGNIAGPDRYASPIIGVRGKATMSTKCSSEPSPGAFCLLCRHGQSRSPPAGGETPMQINKQGKTARTQTRK